MDCHCDYETGECQAPNKCRMVADAIRYENGIRKIKEYLEAKEPRIGDALFDCDALLAK